VEVPLKQPDALPLPQRQPHNTQDWVTAPTSTTLQGVGSTASVSQASQRDWKTAQHHHDPDSATASWTSADEAQVTQQWRANQSASDSNAAGGARAAAAAVTAAMVNTASEASQPYTYGLAPGVSGFGSGGALAPLLSADVRDAEIIRLRERAHRLQNQLLQQGQELVRLC
jgi:hypothetical protein